MTRLFAFFADAASLGENSGLKRVGEQQENQEAEDVRKRRQNDAGALGGVQTQLFHRKGDGCSAERGDAHVADHRDGDDQAQPHAVIEDQADQTRRQSDRQSVQ